MKRNRPSGAQQRKKQKATALYVQSMTGSMKKFLKPSSSVSTSVTDASTSGGETPVSRETEETEEDGRHLPTSRSVEFDGVPDCETSDCNERGETSEKQEEVRLQSPFTTSRRVEDDSAYDGNASENCASDNEEEGDEVERTGEEQTTRNILLPDISDWPIPVPDKLRIDLIRRGNEAIQNKDGPFVQHQREGEKTKGETRSLSTDWFYISQSPHEKILRTWMIYSTKTHNLYCFCCRLFCTDANSINTPKLVTGFQTWWKLNPKVHEHENSKQHEDCFEKWKTLRINLLAGRTFDHVNQKIAETEKRKWRDILERLLDVTLFLAAQNLPFRGHREDVSAENKGNFLQLVELLSKYDPALKEHLIKLQQVQPGHRLPSYLSPTIQNEFISLLGGIVKEKILTDIKNANYFTVIFDSTPDISHIDQMSEIIRYVHIENKKVEVKESFLGFFQLTGKKAIDITDDILHALERDGLDIAKCRGQGYDNASTMAGVHSGVQARICQLNPKALFVPCANHSINLCGIHSFSAEPSCVTFFGTLESLYVFFSASTHRWTVLTSNVPVTVKRLAETRWSAHYEAVKPVFKSFKKIVDVVEGLCDPSETVETRGAAQNLLPAMCDFPFLCFLSLWNRVLEEVNHVQKNLQTRGQSLDRCVSMMRSLKIFLTDSRNDVVEEALEFARETCEEMEIPIVKRRSFRKKKMMPGEIAADEPLSFEHELKRTMLHCIDMFHQEIDARCKGMESVAARFAVLQPRHLVETKESDLRRAIDPLLEHYEEISADIAREIPRLRRLLEGADVSKEKSLTWSALQFLEFIVEYEVVECMPNLVLALKLFLTLCVSVASCERSFSKLKLIKSHLRSTMHQERLSSLAILSIENSLAKEINFEDAISKFADDKVRKTRF